MASTMGSQALWPNEERVSSPAAEDERHMPVTTLSRSSTSRSQRSVSFREDTEIMPSRKRTSLRNVDESHSSADESAPIIRRPKGPAKDYQAISPNLSARTTAAEGTNNSPDVNRTHEQQRQVDAEAQRAAADTENKEESLWRKMLDKYGSVELENKGSVARDHLALERTFLAWLRTSLSFASIGIAITQLFRLNTTIAKSHDDSSDPSASESPQAKLRHVGKPLGATFIAISIVILFIGFHRYFEAQHYVIRGKFPASRGSILVVTGVAGALIVCSLAVILSIAPSAFEK